MSQSLCESRGDAGDERGKNAEKQKDEQEADAADDKAGDRESAGLLRKADNREDQAEHPHNPTCYRQHTGEQCDERENESGKADAVLLGLFAFYIDNLGLLGSVVLLFHYANEFVLMYDYLQKNANIPGRLLGVRWAWA